MLLTVCGFAHGPNKPVTAKQSYSFLENKGQWDKNILFRADIPQGQLFITKQGLSYKLLSDIPATAQDSLPGFGPHGHSNRNTKGHLINVSFEGSSSDYQIITSAPEVTGYHFIKGKTNWVNNAKAYGEVKLQNLYEGIDLKLYFKDNLLKYDFIVQPGRDVAKIALLYKGADSLYLEDNHLVIQTSIGKIYEKPPFTYQLHGRKTKEVACKFKVNGDKVRFEISGHYNPHLPLVIDPELIFSTYSGSTADNFGNTATYDDDGNMYTGGIIFANGDLPATPGPLDSLHGGDHDAFIMKYSPDGRSLLQAVYLGGNRNEYPISMIVNKSDELIILGVTSSVDFPVTTLAFDSTFNGGTPFDPFAGGLSFPLFGYMSGSDIFISKLDINSFTLNKSTFLGGNGNDGIQISKTPCVKNYGDQLRGEVMVDKDDNIYISSQTYSSTINGVPANLSYHINSGRQDAVVAKFLPDLSNIYWLRFLGGSGYDSGLGIRVDSSQQVYVTGGTTSDNIFGLGASGLNKSRNGDVDGYIAKISSDGTSILNSTYLGTSAYDQAYFIDLDYNFDVYVTGQTKGAYPISSGVYNNPNSGQFLHKLSNNLSTSFFSTVFGSGNNTPDISLTAFLVNDCRKIFISGWGGVTNAEIFRYPIDRDANGNLVYYSQGYVGGNTLNMPVTPDAFQRVSDGSGFYFIIFHPEAKTLAYATHFGGMDTENEEHVDGGTSRFDKKGVIYQSVCAGCGGFSNFPTPIPGVWSLTNKSDNCNNASLKFDLGKVVAKFETFDSLKNIPSVYGCVPLTFFIKNRSSGATNYKWNVGNGQFYEKNDSLFLRFNQRGRQNITLIAFDTTICRLTDTARAIINAGDVKVDFAPDKTVCFPASFIPKTKLYTPWAKVNWTPTTGISDPKSPNPTITTSTDINYVITVNDDTLCVKSDTLKVKVRKTSPSIDFQILDMDKTGEKYTFCYPNTGFFRNLSRNYDYLEWKEDNILFMDVDSFYYPFPRPGKLEYKLVIHDTICNKTLEKTRTAILSFPIVTFPDDATVCPDSVLDLSVSGDPGYKYKWHPGRLFADSTLQQQQLKVSGPGSVSIDVSDSIGCETSDTVQYNQFSIPELIAEKEAKICMKKYGGTEITSVTLKDYLWDPVKFEGNPYYATSKGTYILSGHTLDGCPVRDTVNVIEKCDPSLHVPTAFTPNGDGNNDFFSVFGYEVAKFDIKIFNRWGEIIYHSTDFRFKWDGTYRNETVPIGTYPYIISWGGSTFEGTEVSERLTGDITVVR